MEITIQDNNALQHALEQRDIQWEMVTKKIRRSYFINFGLGIFLTISSFLPLGYESKYSQTTGQNEVGYHRDRDAANIMLTLGIAYLFLMSVSIIKFRNRKETYMYETARRAKISYKSINESTITVREDTIRFKNPVIQNEVNWVVFSHYWVYKNYLVLNFGESESGAMMIDKNLLSAGKFEELLTFISRKVRAKLK